MKGKGIDLEYLSTFYCSATHIHKLDILKALLTKSVELKRYLGHQSMGFFFICILEFVLWGPLSRAHHLSTNGLSLSVPMVVYLVIS